MKNGLPHRILVPPVLDEPEDPLFDSGTIPAAGFTGRPVYATKFSRPSVKEEYIVGPQPGRDVKDGSRDKRTKVPKAKPEIKF